MVGLMGKQTAVSKESKLAGQKEGGWVCRKVPWLEYEMAELRDFCLAEMSVATTAMPTAAWKEPHSVATSVAT